MPGSPFCMDIPKFKGLFVHDTGDENHKKISLLRFEVFVVVKI
jgi:hypothetical protein